MVYSTALERRHAARHREFESHRLRFVWEKEFRLRNGLYCTPMRHLHLRKRITKNLEPYPARTPWKRLLDRVVLAAGIVGPALSLPQIILIYSNKDATDISAVSWFGWAALNIVWILYGLVHKELPIAVTYSLWFIINLTVAFGAVLYG